MSEYLDSIHKSLEFQRTLIDVLREEIIRLSIAGHVLADPVKMQAVLGQIEASTQALLIAVEKRTTGLAVMQDEDEDEEEVVVSLIPALTPTAYIKKLLQDVPELGLVTSGKRWYQLHLEAAQKADEQYYSEYPDHRPKDASGFGIQSAATENQQRSNPDNESPISEGQIESPVQSIARTDPQPNQAKDASTSVDSILDAMPGDRKARIEARGQELMNQVDPVSAGEFLITKAPEDDPLKAGGGLLDRGYPIESVRLPWLWKAC